MISRGGAPEIEISLRLAEYAKIFSEMKSCCIRECNEAL